MSGDKEEGEAVDIEIVDPSSGLMPNTSTHHHHKDHHHRSLMLTPDSNLGKVVQTIREILQQFDSQPLKNKEKEGAEIFRRYPKYLTRYSLLHLQF